MAFFIEKFNLKPISALEAGSSNARKGFFVDLTTSRALSDSGRDVMSKLDAIKWQRDFDFEEFQRLGIRPIKKLADVLVEEISATDDPEKSILIEVLHKKICKLDDCVKRLIGERMQSKKKGDSYPPR